MAVAPDTWFVDASQLVRVIQASPASIEGSSHFCRFITGRSTKICSGSARLSTYQQEADSDTPVYDIFATIDQALDTNCVTYPLAISNNTFDVYILDVSACN